MSHPKASTQAPQRTDPGSASALPSLRSPADWTAALRRRLDDPFGPPAASSHGDADLKEVAALRAAARPAAVLAPLVERDGALHVILTVRPGTLPRHAGQVCFPGGAMHAADAGLADAALRETHEEIGVPAAKVELLGQWERYLTGSGFLVTPFVGLVSPDAVPRPCPDEVEEIFTAPLDFLLDPVNHREESRMLQGRRRRFTAIAFGDYYIWGATAEMLRALHVRLSGARP